MAASTPRRSTATISRSGRFGKYLSGKSGAVLEAGSGTGQHVVHFAGKTLHRVAERSQRGASDKHRAWRADAGLSKSVRRADRSSDGTGFRS